MVSEISTGGEAAPARAGRHAGHRHDAVSPDGANPHLHIATEAAPPPRRRGLRAGERLFLASAIERVAAALVVVAVIWLAVFWAIG